MLARKIGWAAPVRVLLLDFCSRTGSEFFHAMRSSDSPDYRKTIRSAIESVPCTFQKMNYVDTVQFDLAPNKVR
jgi:hypothetical protein